MGSITENPAVMEGAPSAPDVLNKIIVPLLGNDRVDLPPGTFDGTNLQDVEGRLLSNLKTSPLEKVLLWAAGCKRPPEFVTVTTGELTGDNENGFILLPDLNPNDAPPIESAIKSILNKEKVIGFRISPAATKGDTKASRPFAQIVALNGENLIKNPINDEVIGYYEQKSETAHLEPYYFKEGDGVELFIEPKGDVDEQGRTRKGGFVFHFNPNGDNKFTATLTTNGLSVRFAHTEAAEGNQIESAGIWTGDDSITWAESSDPNVTFNHTIIEAFIKQDNKALRKIAEVVRGYYPNSTINIQVHYAYVDGKLVICAFDFEIPEKVEAQWREVLGEPRYYRIDHDKSVIETLESYPPQAVFNRYLRALREGD